MSKRKIIWNAFQIRHSYCCLKPAFSSKASSQQKTEGYKKGKHRNGKSFSRENRKFASDDLLKNSC